MFNNFKMNVELSFWKIIKYLTVDSQSGQGITKLAINSLILIANGKAQPCPQGALPFFPLNLGGKDCSHFALVPNVFPLWSLKVPDGFSSGSYYVPQVPNVFPTCSP
jgi:hypothetical protein